jgi:hypothetical protein
MRTFIIILGILFSFLQSARAEIRTYALDHYEVMDTEHTMKVKVLPLPRPRNLVIAGLGTNRVTAQCHTYVLEKETQIYPLNKNIASGDEDSGWFYTSFGNAVTIIQINGDNVKVHELGAVPDTLVGRMVK